MLVSSPSFRRFLIYVCLVVALLILFVFAYQLINAESIPYIVKALKAARAR